MYRLERIWISIAAICIALCLFSFHQARGAVLSAPITELTIPDADSAGVLLDFPPAPAIASLDRLALSISHEWLGDLTLKLITPDGTEIILFERVGLTEDPPDGSAAILGAFEFEGSRGVLKPRIYHFGLTGANLELAARRAVETQVAPVVPSDILYAADEWHQGPFPAGEWRLLLADSAEFSNGVLRSAELFYTAVPEPGVVVLTLLGAGCCWIYGRRQGR